MTQPTLPEKCLKAAISQLRTANTREKANCVFRTWEVLKDHPEFKKEIAIKKQKFLNRK